MSVRVKDILLELKDRVITAGGFPTYVGREFLDPTVDPLPMVGIFFSKDGEKSLETDLNKVSYALQEQELNLIVECHALTETDDPLLELEDIHTDLKAGIFSGGQRIGKGKALLLKCRRSFPSQKFSDISIVQIELRIPFHEEY